MCVFIYMVIALRPCRLCSYIYSTFNSLQTEIQVFSAAQSAVRPLLLRRFTAQPDTEALCSTCFYSFLALLKLLWQKNAACNLQTVCWHLLPAYEEHDRWVRESCSDQQRLGLIFYFKLKTHFLSGVLQRAQSQSNWTRTSKAKTCLDNIFSCDFLWYPVCDAWN